MPDFSKIGKSNRSRGASFERKIAKKLTEGLNYKFKRSPRSGALLREGAINGMFIGGDLVCERNFKFSIECKNCKDSNIESLLKTPQTAALTKYWCQCVYDADVTKSSTFPKYPLLFFHMKSVRTDYVIMSPEDVIATIGEYPTMNIRVSQIPGPVKIHIDNKEVEMDDIPSMAIFIASDFIELASKNIERVFYMES
jgi:hypothetical protein